MTTIRKMYSRDFKLKAVELIKERGNASSVAKELGIGVTMLYKWQSANEHGKLSDVGLKEKSAEEQEIIRLRKALQEAQIERDILKKAVGIFTKNDQ
jgi:transposase